MAGADAAPTVDDAVSRPGRLAVLCGSPARSRPRLRHSPREPHRPPLRRLARGRDRDLPRRLPAGLARARFHGDQPPCVRRARGAPLARALAPARDRRQRRHERRSRARLALREGRPRGGRARRAARCVVWSTIVRPPYQGVSYDGVQPGARSVASRSPAISGCSTGRDGTVASAWFGRDGVHPTATRLPRARAAADARASCSAAARPRGAEDVLGGRCRRRGRGRCARPRASRRPRGRRLP